MRWLIITDNEAYSNDLDKALKDADKSNKLVTCSFSKDELKKQKKNFLDFAACIIFSDKEDGLDIGNILQISGYFAAYQIPVFTNFFSISDDTIFDKDGIKKFDDFKEISSYITQKYNTLEKDAKQRIAKKNLLDKGLPFTSDCFATYIAKNKVEIFNEFIEAGMSVNSRDDMGVPMLNIACRNDNKEFAEILLDLGAELNASSDDRGYTAVMDAVWRGNEEIAKLLIEKGADLNTINKEGQTNLILAVGANKTKIVKLLAENGADPDVKDMMGMSAYQYATLFKKDEIAAILAPFHKA